MRQPGIVTPAVDALPRARNAVHKGHGDLRAEAGAQPQGELRVVSSTLGKIQVAQVGIGLEIIIVMGYWGHQSRFQCLGSHNILHAHPHGVAGVALGVGDHHPVRHIAKTGAQGADLGAGAAAAGGSVGFMRNKHSFGGDRMPINPEAVFRSLQQAIHHLAHVGHIEAGAVKRGVGNIC